MKILLIHNFSADTNGEDVYVSSLYSLLRKNKHDVIMYAKHNKSIESSFIANLNIAKGLFGDQRVADELTRVINRFTPDVAHIHNVYPLITPIAYRVCAEQGVGIVQTVHNYRSVCPKSFLFRNGRICEECVGLKFFSPSIVHGCYKKSRAASLVYSTAAYRFKQMGIFDEINKFIFPSEFTKKYYRENLHIPVTKTSKVPYFVNVDNKDTYKERGDCFLFVGRLSEEKGIIQLLDVFASDARLKLVVIGDGPLREQVKPYQKYRNIHIKGFLSRNEIFQYMRRTLGTIIPSLWYEVLPMVLIESFASGTPVFVPRVGVFTHLVREKETGIFFRYADFGDLKNKLLYMQAHQNLVKTMATLAYREYETKYTEGVHLASLLGVYSDTIKLVHGQ